MMKLQRMLSVALLFSALLLTGLLLTTAPQPRITYGDTIASGNDYTLLATSKQAGGDADLVTVVDNQRQRTLTYRYRDGRLTAVGTADLTRWFPVKP